MPIDTLNQRDLNRALLARQMLLCPAPLPAGPGRAEAVTRMVEHLAGLQAQAPFPPYFGLWSRLVGFQPADLAELLVSRQVVRIALMRSTIHLVSARDCLTFRPLVQPVLDRSLPAIFGKQFAGLDAGALAAAGRALVDAEPRTFSELGNLLAPDWPGHAPTALAQGIRALVPLVQVPPRAVWGAAGQARHTSAEAWLGRPLDPGPPVDAMITRYLAAFGPARVADVQAWSGLTRLGGGGPAPARPAGIPRRAGAGVARPAGRAAARPGCARTRPPGRRVRQSDPVACGPRPRGQRRQPAPAVHPQRHLPRDGARRRVRDRHVAAYPVPPDRGADGGTVRLGALTGPGCRRRGGAAAARIRRAW